MNQKNSTAPSDEEAWEAVDSRGRCAEGGVAGQRKRLAWRRLILVAVLVAVPDTSWGKSRLHDIGDTGSSFAGPPSFSTSSAASGIVAQYRLSTCLRAGRRIGLGKKKSMPESIHSFTLLSSAKAVRATIGAE